MARILCLTSSISGVLYPGVELARRLDAAGHLVTYASFPEAAAVVAANGLEFVPLEPGRYEEFLAEDRRHGFFRRLLDLRSRRERAMESLGVESLDRVVRDLEPDLLLIAGEMHEHVIAASAAGVPIALLNSFVSIWRCPGLPPPHRLARPGVGWKGTRVGIGLLWLALWLGKLHRAGSRKLWRVGCDRLSLLRRLAGDSGFDLRRETDAGHWLKPFTYRRLPVLSLHALEFEFPHQPPERVSYVGPMALEVRGDEGVREPEWAELEAIFERCSDGRRALIYAGFGSFFSSGVDFLRRLVEAAAGRDDWELVISLGGRLDPALLGSLPPGVSAFRWLPQLEVLRRSDVAVVHGGINTVDECVLNGVPMLVYCGFETDMAGTTSRIVHHGLGLAGDRRGDRPAEIRARLERLLAEPGFRENVERMRARYVTYAENGAAERVVESLLASSQLDPPSGGSPP